MSWHRRYRKGIIIWTAVLVALGGHYIGAMSQLVQDFSVVLGAAGVVLVRNEQ